MFRGTGAARRRVLGGQRLVALRQPPAIRGFTLSTIRGQETTDHYAVLGVDAGAPKHVIRESFVRLTKKMHPDVCRDDPLASQRFARVTAAYDVLKDEGRRKQYDRQRGHAAGGAKGQSRRRPAGGRAASGLSSRRPPPTRHSAYQGPSRGPDGSFVARGRYDDANNAHFNFHEHRARHEAEERRREASPQAAAMRESMRRHIEHERQMRQKHTVGGLASCLLFAVFLFSVVGRITAESDDDGGGDDGDL